MMASSVEVGVSHQIVEIRKQERPSYRGLEVTIVTTFPGRLTSNLTTKTYRHL